MKYFLSEHSTAFSRVFTMKVELNASWKDMFMKMISTHYIHYLSSYIISCSPDPTTNFKTKYESLISQTLMSTRLFLTKVNWQKRLEKLLWFVKQFVNIWIRGFEIGFWIYFSKIWALSLPSSRPDRMPITQTFQ